MKLARSDTRLANAVRPLYWGRVIDDNLRGGVKLLQERVWSNAEDFLDFLDTATVDRMLMGRLEQMLSTPRPSAQDLSVAARRLFAAECSSFLGDTSTRREQWQPYFRWANQLIDDHDDSDTIITFNYDRVVETLFVEAAQRPVVLLPDALTEAWTGPFIRSSLDVRRRQALSWPQALGPRLSPRTRTRTRTSAIKPDDQWPRAAAGRRGRSRSAPARSADRRRSPRRGGAGRGATQSLRGTRP